MTAPAALATPSADATVRLVRFAPPDCAARAVASDGRRWRRRDGETAEAFEARVLGYVPVAVALLPDVQRGREGRR